MEAAFDKDKTSPDLDSVTPPRIQVRLTAGKEFDITGHHQVAALEKSFVNFVSVTGNPLLANGSGLGGPLDSKCCSRQDSTAGSRRGQALRQYKVYDTAVGFAPRSMSCCRDTAGGVLLRSIQLPPEALRHHRSLCCGQSGFAQRLRSNCQTTLLRTVMQRADESRLHNLGEAPKRIRCMSLPEPRSALQVLGLVRKERLTVHQVRWPFQTSACSLSSLMVSSRAHTRGVT